VPNSPNSGQFDTGSTKIKRAMQMTFKPTDDIIKTAQKPVKNIGLNHILGKENFFILYVVKR